MRAVLPPIGISVVLLIVSAVSTARADIDYQFVTVGNPGNANDPATGNHYGGVGYTYDIGEFDVTLSQYATFLNAVANSDPYGLYYASMGSNLNIAGISRSGSSGSYLYSVIGNGQLPMAYTTWFDAARFANWMQNGQPTGLGEVAGSTEQGAYTLNGDTTSGLETKNAGAVYWIPTENEWYKAAYYDPTLNSGAGGYWTYATRSNTAPGNSAQNPTPANQANYNNGVYAVTQSSTFSSSQLYLTPVGLFSNSASYYGTYDQNGEVEDWNDAVINSTQRGIRGGDWQNSSINLGASSRTGSPADNESHTIGFRLATDIPEPNATSGLIIAGAMLISRRKTRC